MDQQDCHLVDTPLYKRTKEDCHLVDLNPCINGQKTRLPLSGFKPLYKRTDNKIAT